MSIEDDDDRPHRDIYQYLPIGLAALLTLAAIGLCFVTIRVPVKPQAPAAAQVSRPAAAPPANPGEVMIGVGAGSVIHPRQHATSQPPTER